MLFKRAFEIWQQNPEQNASELARTLNNLGEIRVRLERYEEAEELFQQSLELRDTTAADPAPDRIVSLAGLGSCRWGQGRFNDARKYFERSLDAGAHLGTGHDTLMLSVLQRYKNLLQKMGRKKEAQSIELRARSFMGK
jgi:tetratricopeptide (TPR) repeat protein